MQSRAGPLLHRQLRRVWRGTQELGFRPRDVDDWMEANGLCDDAAPAGIEGPEDVVVGFSRRSGREKEWVLEPQAGKRGPELCCHTRSSREALTIASGD